MDRLSRQSPVAVVGAGNRQFAWIFPGFRSKVWPGGRHGTRPRLPRVLPVDGNGIVCRGSSLPLPFRILFVRGCAAVNDDPVSEEFETQCIGMRMSGM